MAERVRPQRGPNRPNLKGSGTTTEPNENSTDNTETDTSEQGS